MKKAKFLTMMSLIVTSLLVLFTGCDDSPRMDVDKCTEVALEYLEEKYQTEFKVLESGEVMKFVGSAGYAEVIVNIKGEETDNRYVVVVYPDGSTDEDEDGYYDSYKVVSDDYMGELIGRYAKKEVDKLLKEAGLTRFISRVSIEESVKFEGFSGFAADFSIITENDFSLNQLLDNYNIKIHCYIEVSEKEFNDTLQDNIINKFQPLVSGDSISYYMVVHPEETYIEREKIYKEDESLEIKEIIGIKEISFYIRDEEDENEFK